MIPEALARQPRYRHFPIPYVTVVEGGVPDFKRHDPDRRMECARFRLCQLCGELMDPDALTFVGFPWAAETRSFGEPPMHEECMEWAWEVCPWLAAGKSWRERLDGTFADRPPEEPEQMLVAWVSGGYQVIEDERGALVWLPSRITRSETRTRGAHVRDRG